eukprot:3215945-Amphidinium_carterae.1
MRLRHLLSDGNTARIAALQLQSRCNDLCFKDLSHRTGQDIHRETSTTCTEATAADNNVHVK